MQKEKQALSVRWFQLAVGMVAMLFAGVLYAWSILKAPFAAEFAWGASALALNFTLAMCFFCVGGLLGAQLARRAGHKVAMAASGVLSALGFVLTATLSGASVTLLYITYGVLAGLGIGIAYNVVIATVSAWFPDKKGLCSGCLMMSFGTSALLLGNLANALFASALGWRTTYVILGIAIGAVLIIGLFAAFAWRGFYIATHSQDKFSSLLVMGIIAHVIIQVILNICVVTNTIPSTGISLPFFSYGGTSLIILLCEMGLVLAVSRYSYTEKA